MTDPMSNLVSSRSAASNRNVLPGWTSIQNQLDWLEVQIDMDSADLSRDKACLLMECWIGSDLMLQSIVPMRVFDTPNPWCVFLPAQGRLYIRALDLQPSPPFMAGQWIIVDPTVAPLSATHVTIKFPDRTPTRLSRL